MDPQTITAPLVCSFAGHDGPFGAFSVKRLVATGMVEQLKNMRAVSIAGGRALARRLVSAARPLAPEPHSHSLTLVLR